MALKKAYPNPYGTGNINNAYYRIVEANLNFAEEVGRLTVNIYYDRDSRDANKPPVGQIAYPLSKVGTPAIEELKDENGTITRPGRPGFPSFSELVDGVVVPEDIEPGTKAFDVIKTALYSFLKTRPEFEGAQDDI